MIKQQRRLSLLVVLLLAVAVLAAPVAARAETPTFTVGWSVYAGWNPYFYMQKSGILKKWADKYGIAIKVQRFDYAASLDSFVAKNIDACTMTNMEALDMPAAAGVDSTAIIVGDYSNGNDAVLVRNNLTFANLPGKPIMLVEKTVSEYLLERGMVLNGQQAQLAQAQPHQHLRLRHRRRLPQQQVQPGRRHLEAPRQRRSRPTRASTPIFDSSKIPGEILDLLVVRTDILNTPNGQKFAKAITGAWYETFSPARRRSAQRHQVLRRRLRRHRRLLQGAAQDHRALQHSPSPPPTSPPAPPCSRRWISSASSASPTACSARA